MDKKTKVCFVSIFSYPLFNPDCDLTFGGAEVQISLIAKELARDENLDINVIVADTGQGEMEIHEGVKVHKAYKRGLGKINALGAPFVLYKKLKSINPDVVVCRAAGVEVGIAGFYAYKNKKKFIYSIAHFDDLTGKHSRGLRGLIYQLGFNLATNYIAQTEDQKKYLEKKTQKKISIIKNSFPAPKDLKEKMNTSKVLWIGRSVDFKRPEKFIELAELMPEKKFEMVLQKTAVQRWEELRKHARGVRNLKFIEKIPFEKINAVFQSSSLYVNTSTEEGFPNTFIQSTMYGVPIISLNINPDNFINEYRCGVCCDDDVERMASMINSILSDRGRYQMFSDSAKRYFSQNHDIKVNILKWKELLKK
ncbi:hypothetical protein C0584_01720 [Candidatus Parcubacteria bacterium]|nr:MAG: hypothetical protein C0584_01720 [Candidatus Parcubacteria bacterium]